MKQSLFLREKGAGVLHREQHSKTSHGRQRGQALTEFIVIGLALIPLFLLMPVIAKYQDIVQATQMASRYVAFEAMTRNEDSLDGWKSANQLAGEVRRRFFSNADAPIKTNDTAGNFKAHQNLFWRDPKDQALIKDFDSDVNVSFGSNKSASNGDAGFNSVNKVSDGMPFKSVSAELGLPADGIYTANISVALLNLPKELMGYTKSYDEFKNINLQIVRSTSLVVNPWAAKEPAQVESRIDKPLLFPAGYTAKKLSAGLALDVLVGMVEIPKYFPAICTKGCGPKLGELEFWRDTVPADRLK